jgi:large subunit ribosomal protein L9
MNVILLEKLGRLGGIGDQVRVKSGFGRNYLIPFGKAVPATEANIAQFEARREELEKAAAERKQVAEQRAARLAQLSITIPANAGDEGKLFGSIGTRDIAEAITKAGVEVVKSEVRMPAGVIRELGEYTLDIQLHSEVTQPVKITVIPE